MGTGKKWAAWTLLTTILISTEAIAFDFEEYSARLAAKETAIDLDGDGVFEAVRQFDSEGRIRHAAYNYSDGLRETLDVSLDRTNWVRVYSRAGQTTAEVREWFTAEGLAIRAENLQFKRGAPAARITEEFDGPRVRITESKRDKKGKWTVVSSLNRLNRLETVSDSFLERYSSCDGSAGTNVAECRDQFARVFNREASGRMSELVRFSQVVCRRERTLETGTGIQIDLESCGRDNNEAAIQRIQASISDVTRGMGCLARFNRNVTQRLAQHLRERPTVIRCGGDSSADISSESLTRDVADTDPMAERIANCGRAIFGGSATGESSSGDSGPTVTAFSVPSNGSITLASLDPNIATPAALDNLPSKLMHEFMHVARIPHDERFHNPAGILRYLAEIRQCNQRAWTMVSSWRYADPVYGCESVCGGSPMGSGAARLRTHPSALSSLPVPGTSPVELFRPPRSLPIALGCSACKNLGVDQTSFSLFEQTEAPDPQCLELTGDV